MSVDLGSFGSGSDSSRDGSEDSSWHLSSDGSDESDLEDVDEELEAGVESARVATLDKVAYATGKDALSMTGSYARENLSSKLRGRIKAFRGPNKTVAREMCEYLAPNVEDMSQGALKEMAYLAYKAGVRTEDLPSEMTEGLPIGEIKRGSTNIESMMPLVRAGAQSRRWAQA